MRSVPRGFTLLELLVAIAIFAVIGMLAFTGYNQLLTQSERVNASMKRARAVQLAVMRFTQDFAELEPRPIREPLGSAAQAALLADGRGAALVQLTRAGWSNPAAVQRATLQRVAYRIDGNKLFRDHWLVLDRTLSSEPVSLELLDNVRSVRLRFMDGNREWQDAWPPEATNRAAATPGVGGPGVGGQGVGGQGVGGPSGGSDRPLAVEVILDLEDWGSLNRVIEVPG